MSMCAIYVKNPHFDQNDHFLDTLKWVQKPLKNGVKNDHFLGPLNADLGGKNGVKWPKRGQKSDPKSDQKSDQKWSFLKHPKNSKITEIPFL